MVSSGGADSERRSSWKIHTRNPVTVLRHRRRKAQDRVVDAITAFAGSTSFIYLHSVWFSTWIIVNSGLLGQQPVFDRFPFGLLTLIVSLEAIFLSTFVLITQNRQASQDAVKEESNFETDVRAEIWTIHIGQKLGLDADQIEQMVQETIKQARKS